MTDSDWEITTFDSEGYGETLKEITRSHWKSSESRTSCINHNCGKKFSLLERKHHCRRCGDVFCQTCLQYRRRLSFLANYDPNGKLYKVCSVCFEEGGDNDLKVRNLTNLYNTLKVQGHQRKMTCEVGNMRLSKSSRERLNLNTECTRLREGFMKSVGSSEMRRTIQEMKVLITTPSWQKSSNWMVESMSEKCQNCASGFGLMKKKYSCKLCGQVLCKSCIRKELLVYIPDTIDVKSEFYIGKSETDTGKSETDIRKPENEAARLVIIKVAGSPEVEPEISLLLHVCTMCRQYVVNNQIAQVEEDMRSEVKDKTTEVIEELTNANITISQLQHKIVDQLSKYQEVVESLEDGSRTSGDGSNTKVLAKSQEDISDYFSSLVLKLPTVKKLQDSAETSTQHKFCRNYLKAKSDFYIENTNLFKALKRKLSESASPQILEYIQRIVDKHAIVSAQIYIRQLIFESLHLSQKHSLKGDIADLLKHLDVTIEKEASVCLAAQGEDIDEHTEHLRCIVIAQMKDHRLVRVSKRQLASQGSKHVAELLIRRLCDVLEQVNVQLNMKSINRSFKRTKSVLELSRTSAQKLVVTDLM